MELFYGSVICCILTDTKIHGKKPVTQSSYIKNCQTQSIRHTFTPYLPINSALIILDMTLLFVSHSLSTRNNVISLKCDPLSLCSGFCAIIVQVFILINFICYNQRIHISIILATLLFRYQCNPYCPTISLAFIKPYPTIA